MFKELCDSGKINRFDKGVYYIPKQSRLKGGVPLGQMWLQEQNIFIEMVEWKVIIPVITFANQLGITTQVPYVVEIVSNNASSVLGKLT